MEIIITGFILLILGVGATILYDKHKASEAVRKEARAVASAKAIADRDSYIARMQGQLVRNSRAPQKKSPFEMYNDPVSGNPLLRINLNDHLAGQAQSVDDLIKIIEEFKKRSK